MEPKIFDTAIIGGGPAGCAAAVYTARKRIKTLLITESFGGQSIISDDIQNWIGELHISGLDLAKKLEAHVRFYIAKQNSPTVYIAKQNSPTVYSDIVEIKSAEKVLEVKSVHTTESTRICDFEIRTEKEIYLAKTVILAAGARPRKLKVPGEDQFESKGVVYCSTCDSALFANKKVAVVGGGNAGLEAVQDLFPYAAEIYLLEYADALKGDQATQEEIKKNPKLKAVFLNAETLEILGDQLVTGIKYKDRISGQEKILSVDGVFIQIGSIPNSEIVKNLVQLDAHGQIMINFKYGTTSHPGVFAAGDITDDPYKQNNIAAGDGIKAALSAYSYLLNREKRSPAEERY